MTASKLPWIRTASGLIAMENLSSGLSISSRGPFCAWLTVFSSTVLLRQWPLGLHYDYFHAHHIASSSGPLPLLNVTLHLSHPPTDKLQLNPSIDACRSNFMNMIKQADYVRWGSTRRVTSLRKVDQDGLWEGVLQGEQQRFGLKTLARGSWASV